ncbi:MAG: DUF5106 domain-containing protein [Spirosomataceae bacterium]
MKRSITHLLKGVFLIIFCFTVSTSWSQVSPEPGHYAIKFKIRGVKDTTLSLSHYFGYNQQVPKDTAKVDKEGNLLFEGNEKLPAGLYFIQFNKYGLFDFIIDDDQEFTIEMDTTSFVKSVKVTGSKENELYFGFQQEYAKRVDEILKLQGNPNPTDKNAKPKKLDAETEKKVTALGEGINTYVKKFLADNSSAFAAKIISAPSDPDIPLAVRESLKGKKDSSERIFYYYKHHFMDKIDLSDERMMRTPFAQRKIDRYLNDLTVQSTDSVCKEADYLVSLSKSNSTMKKYIIYYITNTYENPKILGTDGVFICMGEKYYIGQPELWDTATVRNFKDRVKLMKPLLLGKVLPNMYPSDSLNNFKPLHSINSKYTIVFLYDPNCGHCRETTPKLVKLYDEKKFKERGITVYMVSIERNVAEWKKFIREFKTGKFINAIDVHINPQTKKEEYYVDFKNTYDVFATPKVFILDRDKKIIAKLPVEQMDDFFIYYDKYLEQQAKDKTKPAGSK